MGIELLSLLEIASMMLLRVAVVLLLVLCSGVKVHGEHDTNLSKLLQMIEKDVEAIQQAADDKALEDVVQFPEIYEDETKETTDEGEDSGVIVADDDKKQPKKLRYLAKLFCQRTPRGKYRVNCNDVQKEWNKKYCESLHRRKCRVTGTKTFDQEEENQQEENKMENEFDENTNAYDTSSLDANEDDDKKRTRKQWRKLFCATSLTTQKYILDCNILQKRKRKESCVAHQNGLCSHIIFGAGDYEDDNNIEEDDEENSNKWKFVRLCCSVNKNAEKFNCKILRKPKRRNNCKKIQKDPGRYCGKGGVTVFGGDNQTDEDSYMMM